ncbi:MAG: GNAT family N-acetyltransferase [Pseudonocardiales bacterium]|nr:GNAT family N-acetyltransferase [Pseudonocardiales bacterium]
MTPLLRRATADDLRALAEVDARGFGNHQSDADLENFKPLFEPDRFLLACDPDSGAIVGVTGSYPLEVTLPGGAVLPAPGVTWVSVDPTMRRRGILRAMFTEQHAGFVEDGLVLSLLTASEGAIYGRFGYGVTTLNRSFEILRRRAVFRADVPDPGGVRYLDAEAARKHAPEVHRRWCARTPGAVTRSDAMWDMWFRDDERWRGGGSGLFYLAHRDGFASYRVHHSDDSAAVQDMFAATDDAYIALWRVLLGLDLVEKVTGYKSVAMDDPLPLMLADPRRVQTTHLDDGMWSRVLDVPAALAARTYAAEIDVVLDVHDGFLGRGGRFRLRGGPEGATCDPTDATADVEFAIGVLGSLLFGAGRATTFARAGLAHGLPEVLRRMDAAFTADRDPQHGTGF